MTEKTLSILVIAVCLLAVGISIPIIYVIGDARLEKQISEIRIPPRLTEPQPSVIQESPQEEDTIVEKAITGRLINTITGNPMPGIPVVAAMASLVRTVTDIDGSFNLDLSEVTTGQDVFELYGVGGLFFEEPDTVAAVAGDDVTLYLTPKDPPDGMTVTFPDVEYTSTDGDSPILRGRVVDAQSGKPMADLPVVFFGESLSGKTDEDGFFSVYTLISGVHRVYFMGDEAVDDPEHLYQVISVKGYEGVLNFSL